MTGSAGHHASDADAADGNAAEVDAADVNAADGNAAEVDAAEVDAAEVDAAGADGGRFAEEIRRDERYEARLAVKALICVAIVAVLIVTRLIGF